MKSLHPAITKILACSVFSLSALGCADQGWRRAMPQLETPVDFTQSGNERQPNRWWEAFGDAKLNSYVDDGLSDNFTLKSAAFQIQAARAVTRREASDFWPDINGILGLGSRMGPGENVPSYNVGLDSNWQIDLWGEIESRVEAQRLRGNATCWNYHAGALALSSEVTSVWFALIEANAQAELLQVQIETNRVGADLQEDRFGIVRAADVLRQRQLLESTLEQAVVVESQKRVLAHRLAVLLGQMPQGANFEPGTKFPELPPLPSTGIPAELLLRRPDIQRNYSALAAADADLASAISRRYPRLNLSGSLQNIAEHPEDLLKDWFASVAAQLIAPLFDGGQRLAEIDRTAAVKLVLFNEYAQSVLVAFQEVEDALAQEKYQIQRIEHIEEQIKLAGESFKLLRDQYQIGDAQYLDVLNAITGQQRLQRQLLQAQLDLRLIRVSLYLALAGNIDPNGAAEGFIPTELIAPEMEAPSSDATIDTTEDVDAKEMQQNRLSNLLQPITASASQGRLAADYDFSFLNDVKVGDFKGNESPEFLDMESQTLDRLSGTSGDE